MRNSNCALSACFGLGLGLVTGCTSASDSIAVQAMAGPSVVTVTAAVSPASTTIGVGTFNQIGFGAFQLQGNITETLVLWASEVSAIANGNSVTSGSLAVKCSTTGGGFFVPCIRTREVGDWQCGQVSACAGSATASLPFTMPFVIGDQNHLDIGLVVNAPTFISTVAVLAIQ